VIVHNTESLVGDIFVIHNVFLSEHRRQSVLRRFLGDVADVAPVYAAADVFLLPSAYEALPLVVLEALARGLPVVATEVGGISALLDECPGAGIIAAATVADVTSGVRSALLTRRRDAARQLRCGRTGPGRPPALTRPGVIAVDWKRHSYG
jgi:glycosyltransferase involved in cell wall biosynthesis